MERISKSIIDAIANATVIWIEDQAKTGVPLTLNLIKEGIIKAAKNLFENKKSYLLQTISSVLKRQLIGMG